MDPPIPLPPEVVTATPWVPPTIDLTSSNSPSAILQPTGIVNPASHNMMAGMTIGGQPTLGQAIVNLERKVIDDFKRTGDSTQLKSQLRKAIDGNWKDSPNADRLLNDLVELVRYGGPEIEAVIVAALSVSVQGPGVSNPRLTILDVPGASPQGVHIPGKPGYLQLDLSKSNYGLSKDYSDEIPANMSIILGHELGHWYFGMSDPTNVVLWENLLRTNYNANGAPKTETLRSTYSGIGLFDSFNIAPLVVQLPNGRKVTYIVDVKTFNLVGAIPYQLYIDNFVNIYRRYP